MEMTWEQYIRVHGREVSIVPFVPGRRDFGLAMPEDLQAMIKWTNSITDYYSDLDDVEPETLDALWESMKEAFEEFYPDAEDEWRIWTGHQLCEAIIQIVANGMRYVWMPVTQSLSWKGNPTAEYGRVIHRMQTFELFMVSLVKTATLDFRCPAWLAGRPMNTGLSGLCRHYAKIARVLFVAAQHATGRWQDWDMVVMRGRASLDASVGHAWNWLVDHREGVIYSFDITRADWQVDRNDASSIFNYSLDGTRHLNRSAFIGGLLWAYSVSDGHASQELALSRALHTMIDLDEISDLLLLYGLTQQDMVHDDVVDLIVDYLETELDMDSLPRRSGVAAAARLADPERQREFLEMMLAQPGRPLRA